MRLSHVKYHHGTVVEEEQTAIDALRNSCGLSCQEMGGGCIKKAAGRDAFHTGGNRGYPIYKHFNIPNIAWSYVFTSVKGNKDGFAWGLSKSRLVLKSCTNQNGGFQDAWIDQRQSRSWIIGMDKSPKSRHPCVDQILMKSSSRDMDVCWHVWK